MIVKRKKSRARASDGTIEIGKDLFEKLEYLRNYVLFLNITDFLKKIDISWHTYVKLGNKSVSFAIIQKMLNFLEPYEQILKKYRNHVKSNET